jgi:uncharacterized coiled-coil DUF342 family protein
MKLDELNAENAALKAGNLEIVKENERIRENAEAMKVQIRALNRKMEYWRERADLAENRVFRRDLQIRELLSEFGALDRMGSILGIDNFAEGDLL